MTKTMIVIHALDVPSGWMISQPVDRQVDRVAVWHKQNNGWAGFGYALLIHQNGSIGKGRDLNKDGDVYDDTGAHVRGYNSESIGIALTGGKGGRRADKFDKNFTEAQRLALWDTIYEIRERFGDGIKIVGHNELANRECPCFDVQEFLRDGDPRKRNGGKIAAGLALTAPVAAIGIDAAYLPHAAIVAAIGLVAFLIWRIKR